jgi:hypothetical protein
MPTPDPVTTGLKLLRHDTLPDLYTVVNAITGDYTLRIRKDDANFDLTFAAVVPSDTQEIIRDGLLTSAPVIPGVTVLAVSTDAIRIAGAEDARFVSSIEDEPGGGDSTLLKDVMPPGDPDFFGTQVAPAFVVNVPKHLQSLPVRGLSLRAIVVDTAGDPVAPGSGTLSIDVLDIQRVAGVEVVCLIAALTTVGLDEVQPVAGVVGGMRIGVRLHTFASLPATADQILLAIQETTA